MCIRLQASKPTKPQIRLEVLATLLQVIMDSIKLPVEASCYNSLPNTVDLPLKGHIMSGYEGCTFSKEDTHLQQ